MRRYYGTVLKIGARPLVSLFSAPDYWFRINIADRPAYPIKFLILWQSRSRGYSTSYSTSVQPTSPDTPTDPLRIMRYISSSLHPNTYTHRSPFLQERYGCKGRDGSNSSTNGSWARYIPSRFLQKVSVVYESLRYSLGVSGRRDEKLSLDSVCRGNDNINTGSQT